MIQERMAASSVPGMSLAIVRNGSVVYSQGFGVENRRGEPANSQTSFALASVSKTFVSVLVLQLVEHGQIDLDRSVSGYLPEFQSRNKAASDQITVRHLLNQTSGLSGFVGNLGQHDSSRSPESLQISVERLSRYALVSRPGERFEYSNSNFDVLGALLENIYEMPFEDIVRRQIFEPLGMADSFVVAPYTEEHNQADRYRYWAWWPRLYSAPMGRRLVASGGAFSSTEDMTVYLTDLLSPEPTLISASSVRLLFSLPDANALEGYGLGWFVEGTDFGALAIHDGSIAGATSLVGFLPEEGFGFVILSNASIGMLTGNIRAIEGGVVDILLDRPLRGAETPMLYKFLYLAVLAILIGLLTWVFVVMKNSSRMLGNPRNCVRLLIFEITPSIGLAGLGYVLWVAAPGAFQSSLFSLATFLPDIGLMLGTGAILAFGLAVLRPITAWRKLSRSL